MAMMKTFMLMAVLTAIFLVGGYLMSGEGGMLIALLMAAGTNLFAYWNADKMVLRMNGARQVDRASTPEFYGIVEQLAQRAGMPMPKVFVMETAQPNAFATGRGPENASVAATTGLLKMMTSEEIAGVMAHELAHVKNRDTLIMTVTATMAGALSMLATFAMFFGGNRNNPLGIVGVILMAVLGPLAAAMVQMAISRTREFSADADGAEICGQPLWLASALEKMDRAARGIDNRAAEENPAMAHVYIINPLHAHKVDGLFSTHPATAERIHRLRAMAGAAGPWG